MSLFRFFARKPFAPAVLFCLSMALLFTGCKIEEDEDLGDQLNAALIGTWKDNSAGDSYIVTPTKLTYDDGYGGGYSGTIKYVSNFTGKAGVIIIEYDNDNKPTYYDDWVNFGDPAHIVPLKGNFIGIYYKNLNSDASVEMGVAYIAGGAEKETLDAAKKAFTVDTEGSYFGQYGGPYSKQP